MVDDQGEEREGLGAKLPRRELLALPAQGVIGYGAILRGMDEARADPEITPSNSPVPPQEETLHTVQLPSQANDIAAKIDYRIWAGAIADSAWTELYFGDKLADKISCTPNQAGDGCYDEKEVEQTVDLSGQVGEEIEIRYETNHRGGVSFQQPVTFLVDGVVVPLSAFPLPEVEGPCVVKEGGDRRTRRPARFAG